MSEIKQVWGIIKDYQCADLNMVLEPAVAVWKHQQAKVDEIEHQKSLQELAINQISQANKEWQRINAELKKQIDEYKKLTTSIRNEFDLWSDDSEFADVVEAQIENLEALRGEYE